MGALLENAQDGEEDKAGQEKTKPVIIETEPPFREGVSDEVEREEHTDDENKGVVFALRDGAPAEADRGRLPTAKSGNKGRGCGSPGFKGIAETFPQKGLL